MIKAESCDPVTKSVFCWKYFVIFIAVSYVVLTLSMFTDWMLATKVRINKQKQ